jgi:NADPH2:quinone reductase
LKKWIPSKPLLVKWSFRVGACSINFPDTLIIRNLYQFKPELPFSPGGEVAGIIKEAGEGVKHLKPGDRVFALCGWGGLAEEVEVEAKRVFPLLPGMDFITGASVMYNYGTSYHALKDRSKLQPGETLLVLGAGGGVGLAAVELGKLMGATVIAAASTDEKLKMVCREKGADHVINYSTADIKETIKAMTNGKGVDVVYDPVGDKYAEPAITVHGLEGQVSRRRICRRRDTQDSAQSRFAQGMRYCGCLLGTVCRKRSRKQYGKYQTAGRIFYARQIKAAHS